MVGLIIAVSVLGVAFVATTVVMAIKLKQISDVVAMLTMMQLETYQPTVSTTDMDVYEIDFPNSHKEF